MKGRRAAASAAVLLLSPLIVASDENSAEDWGWDRFHGVDLDLDADGSADKINNSEGSRLAALDEYFARSARFFTSTEIHVGPSVVRLFSCVPKLREFPST